MQTWIPKAAPRRSPALHHTSWHLDPSRVSLPALFSSHPTLSASAPLLFCVAPDLCMRDARTEHWSAGRAGELDHKKCCTQETNEAGEPQHLHGFLRLSILSGSRCGFLLLSELVDGLGLFLQLREILSANLLSTQTAFLRSQLQGDAEHVYLLCLTRTKQPYGTHRFLSSSRLLLNQRWNFWKDPRRMKWA